MYDVKTEDEIAEYLDSLHYTLGRIDGANRQHQPATVARLCLFLTERLGTVADLATKTLDPQPQPSKGPAR